MKKFETPTIEIERFEATDILTISDGIEVGENTEWDGEDDW